VPLMDAFKDALLRLTELFLVNGRLDVLEFVLSNDDSCRKRRRRETEQTPEAELRHLPTPDENQTRSHLPNLTMYFV
jgi:hypothetical protein